VLTENIRRTIAFPVLIKSELNAEISQLLFSGAYSKQFRSLHFPQLYSVSNLFLPEGRGGVSSKSSQIVYVSMVWT
jgi:hypothetical protein